MDPEKPQDKRKLGELEGGGWSVSATSNDEATGAAPLPVGQ